MLAIFCDVREDANKKYDVTNALELFSEQITTMPVGNYNTKVY